MMKKKQVIKGEASPSMKCRLGEWKMILQNPTPKIWAALDL